MTKERIVFMGTASFSLHVLKMLFEEGYHVVGVVSQPDRYVGRKKVLTMPDVKVEALKHDVPVIQPMKIKEDYQAIIDLQPDLILTAAYGQIIPKALLDAPRLGCVNVHASLLPKYRGGAPV
ncbi:MAG: methionyl-tRNA formyltransferase, partial [Coprobacillus sp.]